MIMKSLVCSIGLCSFTFFASQNQPGRVINYDNKSHEKFTVYFFDTHGNNSHEILKKRRNDTFTINNVCQDVVVKWDKQNVQHNFPLKNYPESKITILPAIAFKFKEEKNQFITFMSPEFRHTYSPLYSELKTFNSSESTSESSSDSTNSSSTEESD